MSTSKPTQRYPDTPKDVKKEKEIVEAVKKLDPLPLKLKALAINTYTLQLKESATLQEDEIEIANNKVEKKFQEYLQSINDIINGTRAPTEAELKDFEQYFDDQEKAKKDEVLANLKPLPDYWLTVLKNDPVTQSHIMEDDEKALKHLTKIEYKFLEDPAAPHNFKIVMHFSPNDYFENDVLTTVFNLRAPRDVIKTEGTEIKWKDGKNLTKKTVTKKQKNKKTGQSRTVTKEEDVPSFFTFFNSVTAPENTEEEPDEEGLELENQILDQMDVAYALLEEVMPFNLEYFLGVRKDYMNEFGDYEGEDDEDDDEDEGDDDEDEGAKGKAKKGKKGGAGAGAGAGAGKQECKQQ